jgi:DNA adenine methylase
LSARPSSSPSGRQQSAAVTWRAIPERLRPAVDRLRDVLIDNRPAVDVIRLYDRPSTVVYADPPYVTGTLVAGDTRNGAQSWARYYRHTMGDAEHLELLDALDRHRGPVLLSGYRSELYDGRLPHWTRGGPAAPGSPPD